MKKIFVTMTTLALVLCMAALPVLAEETAGAADTNTAATATVPQTGTDEGQAAGQLPQMTGKAGRNGRTGQMPFQNGQNSQMPQMPWQNGQNSQMPSQNGRNGMQFRFSGRGGRGMGQDFGGQSGMDHRKGFGGSQFLMDQLLKDGVITQEVYDAIVAYMKEHAPQQASAADPADGTTQARGTEQPALPDGAGAEGFQAPAMPNGAAADGSQAPALPEDTQTQGENTEAELLKGLLESGAITQEQYEALMAKIALNAAAPGSGV